MKQTLIREYLEKFAPDCETVTVTLDQILHTLPTESHGDGRWAWLTVEVSTL